MNRRWVGFAFLAVLAFGTPSARAEFMQLPTLETSTTDPIFSSMASAFAFRSIEPATDLGTRWGFYIGLAANMTDASGLSSIGASTAESFVPGGEIQVGVGLPKGITLEFGIIPSLDYSEASFAKYAGAVKMTLNRTFLQKFPLNVAVRASYGSTSILYVQSQGGGTVNVDYSGKVMGLGLTISKFLGAASFGIDPYVGVGAVYHDSTLTATGTGDLFGNSFPAGTDSADGSGVALQFQAGLLLKLGVIGLAAEYGQMFGLSSYAGKVSIRI